MRKEQVDVNLDFMVDVFIDKGQKLNPNIDEMFRKQQQTFKDAKKTIDPD